MKQAYDCIHTCVHVDKILIDEPIAGPFIAKVKLSATLLVSCNSEVKQEHDTYRKLSPLSPIRKDSFKQRSVQANLTAGYVVAYRGCLLELRGGPHVPRRVGGLDLARARGYPFGILID
jgi:hypothetical protein